MVTFLRRCHTSMFWYIWVMSFSISWYLTNSCLGFFLLQSFLRSTVYFSRITYFRCIDIHIICLEKSKKHDFDVMHVHRACTLFLVSSFIDCDIVSTSYTLKSSKHDFDIMHVHIIWKPFFITIFYLILVLFQLLIHFEPC